MKRLVLIIFVIFISCGNDNSEIKIITEQYSDGYCQYEVVKGIKNGKFISYSNDSIKEEEGCFNDGKIDGEVKSYYLNNRIKTITSFKDNFKLGLQSNYDSVGNLTSQIEFIDTRFFGDSTEYVNRIWWYSDGIINVSSDIYEIRRIGGSDSLEFKFYFTNDYNENDFTLYSISFYNKETNEFSKIEMDLNSIKKEKTLFYYYYHIINQEQKRNGYVAGKLSAMEEVEGGLLSARELYFNYSLNGDSLNNYKIGVN